MPEVFASSDDDRALGQQRADAWQTRRQRAGRPRRAGRGAEPAPSRADRVGQRRQRPDRVVRQARQLVHLAALGHEVARACPGRRRTTPAPWRRRAPGAGARPAGRRRAPPGTRSARRPADRRRAPSGWGTSRRAAWPRSRRRSGRRRADRVPQRRRPSSRAVGSPPRSAVATASTTSTGVRAGVAAATGAAGSAPSVHDTSAGRISVATCPGGPVGGGHRGGRVARTARPCSAGPDPARHVARRRSRCRTAAARRTAGAVAWSPTMLTTGTLARRALCRFASPLPRPGPRCSSVAAGRPAIRA